ncbi:MAG TPA: amidohydrolase family protein [Chloroflexota bacterium]|nr:amidohydrolase family protein [Chloroflexota bacterium]
MSAVLDADTHILEPSAMWDHFDRDLYPRRPVKVSVPNDTLYSTSNVFWLIDGEIFPKPAGKGGFLLATPTDQEAVAARPDVPSRELIDLDLRLQDMQSMGTDYQVIYPTLFLAFLTQDANLEVALCKAYNRYLGSVWEKQPEKLRWVVIPPLRSLDASIQELRYGKQHGAVGIFFRGIEKDRTLEDPYFFPLYEEAQSLDLPICIHTGAGCPDWTRPIDVTTSFTFPHVRLPPLVAFRNIVANKVPEKFPTLRFGFVETGASWVPYLLHSLRGTMGDDFTDWGPKLFDRYRLYVSYEDKEDLGYLVRYVGEDNLFAGSDYGHHGGGQFRGDPSAQPQMVKHLRERDDVSPAVVDKVLYHNARRLYGM